MRIAYLGIKGLPSKGGTERVVEAIVKRLVGKHDITIYCDSKYTPKGIIIPGVRLIRVPSIPGKYTHPTLLFILYAFHAVFFGNYDLIHLHGVDSCFTLPILKLRYKIFSTSHGSQTRVQRQKWGKIAQFLLQKNEYPFCYLSNFATSVSYTDAKFYRSRYHVKVAYIPNGVEENITYDLDAAGAELNKHGIKPGNYLMFAAGRIDPSKGCHLAIEAFNDVKSEIPLLIVGDLKQVPLYEVALRQMAANRPVIFLPLIIDKELLYGLVKLCRLFIFPSISEGMSIMLLEAASLGVPIVCSDIEENKTVMKNTVLYFSSGDARDLSAKMAYALEQPEQMRALGEEAGALLSKRLTWNKVVACYDRLYQICVQGGHFPDVDSEWLF
jgi:glycosyltransferase involved in cell wall biosynthesis